MNLRRPSKNPRDEKDMTNKKTIEASEKVPYIAGPKFLAMTIL